MDFQVPELGEGVYEAELVTWLVKPGDQIKRGQGLMEVMTDKTSGQEDKETRREEVKETEGNGKPQPKSQTKTVKVTSRSSPSLALKAAPSVRQMARKLGIDLGGVRGSGPEGRILIGDLTTLVT